MSDLSELWQTPPPCDDRSHPALESEHGVTIGDMYLEEVQ